MPDGLVPLIVNIDVEPTPRRSFAGTAAEWDSFPECVKFLAGWRHDVAEITGRPLHLTWNLRIDYQVEAVYGRPDWAVHEFREIIGDLLAAGDGIGIHPHSYRRETSDGWMQEFEDEAWVADRVAGWLDVFSRSLGFPAEFLRFGDRWQCDRVVDVMEQKGVRYDLTVEPGRVLAQAESPDNGLLPDYTVSPRLPYRPSRQDFRRPSLLRRRKIWMIPVTTSTPASLDWPESLHLNLCGPPGLISPITDGALAGNAPVSVVGRTGDLAEVMPYFEENWRYLFSHQHVARFFTATPAEALLAYQGTRGSHAGPVHSAT